MLRPLRPLRRPPIRHLLLVVFVSAALLAVPATASAAGPSANLDCTIVSTQDITPPITPDFGHHSSTSHGLTGTADCTGTVGGQQVAGTGSFMLNSHGTADCESGSGDGNFVLRIPTIGGIKTVPGQFHFSFTAFPPGVTVLTGDLTGSLTFLSGDGDCVNTPLGHSTNRLDVHVAS